MQLSSEKKWAVLRIILGNAQMIGALTAAILLVRSGVGALSISVAAITLSLTVVSRFLFRNSGPVMRATKQ